MKPATWTENNHQCNQHNPYHPIIVIIVIISHLNDGGGDAEYYKESSSEAEQKMLSMLAKKIPIW